MAQIQVAKNRAPRTVKREEHGANGFTADEKAAMKERSRELRQAKAGKADGEAEVLAKIAAMQKSDRVMAKRVHEIVRATAPELSSRTWYGMPAYAKDGKVVCFFKCAQKFKTRYATLGFSDRANLDEGDMWPTEFALTAFSAEVEDRVTTLVQRAVS